MPTLPPSSTVDFEVRRLASPSALWSIDGLGESWKKRLGYCIPYPDEPPLAFSSGTEICQAERYGGTGLAGNSGGVRCGLLNGHQIKGIGRNPLAGVSTDYWHKHGACAVRDGIWEAVWSEFFDAVLPYGVARTLAIIGTGTEFRVDTDEGKFAGVVPRALVIREPAVRPGHFLRSPFAKMVDGRPDLPSDEDRTRQAIAELGAIFTKLGMANPGAPDFAIERGIWTMTARFARQCGRARALRIMHGSLTASNFCLDGRWLDFGTVSVLPDYGQYRMLPGAMPSTEEYRMFDSVLRDLLWHCEKFHVPELTISTQFAALIELLNAEYKSELHDSLLRHTGVPNDWLRQHLHQSEFGAIVGELDQAMRVDARHPWRLYGDDQSIKDWPDGMGALQRGVVNLALDHVTEIPSHLRWGGPWATGNWRKNFAAVERAQLAWLAEFNEVDRPRAATWLALNVLRLNSPLLQFIKPRLWERIRAVDQSSAHAISSFIAAASRMAIDSVAESKADTFMTSSLLPGPSYKVHPIGGILSFDRSSENIDLVRFSDAPEVSDVVNWLVNRLL